MKQSNQFVSGGFDNTIIIWELDTTGKWKAKTELKEHTHFILCIIKNKNEDMLVSGSSDQTVKFLRNKNEQWICQQTVELEDCCKSISLNEQENRLISCGEKSFIYVMQLQSENSWRIVYAIQVVECGVRLSFLNGDQFIFQPYSRDFLELWNYDTKQKQFKKLKKFLIQSSQNCDIYFPIQFIKDLNIVIVKHGKFLNIFKVYNNTDIMLMQTIEFGHVSLYGICSDDGKYIATWDEQSKEIQIQQLKYLE